MIILDIFKYFAQFPLKDGVLRLFSNGKSQMVGYSSLLASIIEMPKHSRIQSLTGFVFGPDEDTIKMQIDKCEGYILFVDYGEINSSTDSKNSIQNNWKMAFTVMGKITGGSDPVEYALHSESTLSIAKNILSMIHSDQAESSWLKELSKSYYLAPFEHKGWSCRGWSVVFDREAADMLNIKNL
jgi:hypothetical protein